jgi:serine/threonine protein kinase
MLDGLHAAHEATDEHGRPLGIVHRDVSPQNVLVGIDGIPRLIDFGVAKATGRLQTTREGQLKGKIGYIPPEQFEGRPADRRSDIYSASVVLWEAIAGKRLFDGEGEAQILRQIIRGPTEPPSAHAPQSPLALDDIIMRGLASDPEDRFATAHDMALAIESAVPPAPTRRVGEWVQGMAARSLEDRAKRIAEIESQPSSGVNVASMGDGNDAEWRRLSERASASQSGASLKAVRSGAPPPSVSSRPDVASSVRRAPRVGSHESERPRSSLVVPTPVHPIDIGSVPRPSAPTPPPPSSAPLLEESGSNPILAQPDSAAALPPKGAPWAESWDGVGWNMALRSISRVHVGLFAMFALILAGGMFSQRGLFGIELQIGTGVWILFSMFMIARMLRWTHVRLDPKELLIEYKPNGRSSTIATPGLARFIVIHAGPGDDADVFYVHFLPVNGETQRLDIDFSTAADARYAMHRLNEMLAQVRGGVPPRKSLASAHLT